MMLRHSVITSILKFELFKINKKLYFFREDKIMENHWNTFFNPLIGGVCLSATELHEKKVVYSC